MLNLPQLTLVTGGAASGKSQYAEQLIGASGLPKIYLATAQIWDDEMAKKVEDHRKSRGESWQTVETGPDLAAAIAAQAQGHALLVDCLTMWITAKMMLEASATDAVESVLDAIAKRAGPTVVVTNEVGQGIVPDTAMGRAFRNEQGRLNQRFAATADSVIAVMSGLPFALKGPLPVLPA